MSVFITTGEYCTSLAAARSLGRRGISVIVGSSTKYASTLHSKYSTGKLIYPPPKEQPREFIDTLLGYLEDQQVEILYPIDDISLTLISEHQQKLREHVSLPIPCHESITTADNKAEMIRLAQKLNIPCPRTAFIQDETDLREVKEEFRFPVITKPHVGYGGSGIAMIKEKDRLEDTFRKIQGQRGPTMIQEYIRGEQVCSSFLFNKKSQPRRIFVQKEHRQYPPNTGPAVYSESIENPDAVDFGLKLLEALKWYGVAQVEFIVDERDKILKLMEINPRLWMSVHLDIAAGVDFPYLIYRMEKEGDIEEDFSYKLGVKARWLIPNDMRYLFETFRNSGKYGQGKRQLLADFIRFKEEDLTYYYLQRDDLLPGLAEMVYYVGGVVSRKIRALSRG